MKKSEGEEIGADDVNYSNKIRLLSGWVKKIREKGWMGQNDR